MKKELTALLSAAALVAAFGLLAGCSDDDSSSGPSNSSEALLSSGENLSSSGVDTVAVNPEDSSLVVPTSIAAISAEGELPVTVDCGEDADRIKSVDADAYINFDCSIKVEPAKGQSVSIKAIRTTTDVPAGWNVMHSFDGEKLTAQASSGPYDFAGQSGSRLSVQVMPPSKGFVGIEMRLEDAADAGNAVVIPFMAVRTK